MGDNRHSDSTARSVITPAERRRYHRQIILPEVGVHGQQKLKAAKVAIFGLGGLGAPCATYLAAAGIGRLTLIDHDEVDVSNLHRQVLFTDKDVDRQKTAVTQSRIRALNPSIDIVALNVQADSTNIFDLIDDNDIVVDCTDNFKTRFAINDACAVRRTPLVQASILQFEAQISVFCAPGGPCYRCLYPEAPPPGISPNCAEAGVIGILPGILGTYQASEVLKLILGIGTPLIGRLAVIDVLENRFDTFAIAANPGCPACSSPSSKAGAGRIAPLVETPEVPDSIATISASDLHRLMGARSDLQILDVRSPAERREQGWIKHDLFIALPDLAENLDRLARDCPVICYCVSGQRSQQAAKMLVENGFLDVRSLSKGILGWSEPVV